jgi:hypothetical protein
VTLIGVGLGKDEMSQCWVDGMESRKSWPLTAFSTLTWRTPFSMRALSVLGSSGVLKKKAREKEESEVRSLMRYLETGGRRVVSDGPSQGRG